MTSTGGEELTADQTRELNRRQLLRAARIAKSFGNTRALDEVDFDLYSGEVHGLVGENGAGKSTLVRILAGLETPDSGTLTVGESEHSTLSPASARSLGIALVPQHVELVEHLSVAENIFLGRWPMRRFGIDRRQMERDSSRILARVGLEIDSSVNVEALSYVEKQMVEVAKISEFFSPRIIILDEPTAALSKREITILFELIANRKLAQVGIVFISHYLSEVRVMCDRVTVLRDGRVVLKGANAKSLSTIDLTQYMVGDIPDLYPARISRPAAERLRIEGAQTAQLTNVALSVAAGEIVGIAAPVGEGVSEFLRALCGVSGSAPKGRTYFDGRPVRIRNSTAAQALGIGYLSEERGKWGVITGRSVRENLTLAILRSLKRRWGGLNLTRERALAVELMDRFRVKASGPEAPVDGLSGGNQQKVLLARLLGGHLKLYVLDDPTRGVDVKSKAEINDILRTVVDSGSSVLMHTADLTELVEMSDRIVLVNGGRVVHEFARGDVAVGDLERMLAAETN